MNNEQLTDSKPSCPFAVLLMAALGLSFVASVCSYPVFAAGRAIQAWSSSQSFFDLFLYYWTAKTTLAFSAIFGVGVFLLFAKSICTDAYRRYRAERSGKSNDQ